jgi:hypothetical protein
VSTRLWDIFTPGRLKLILLAGGIAFIFWGYFGLIPGVSNEFSFHLVSVFVEICLGTLFIYAIVEEIITYEKEKKWAIILFMDHVRIAALAQLIVVVSLSGFVPDVPETRVNDRTRLAEIIGRVSSFLNAPEPDQNVLDAMWEGFRLWEEIFFEGGIDNPRGSYSGKVTDIFGRIKRQIGQVRRINARLEKFATTEEQIEAIFAFETASEGFEGAIEAPLADRPLNQIQALHPFLMASIHMYALALDYHEKC